MNAKPRYVLIGSESLLCPGGKWIENGDFVPDSVPDEAIKSLVESGTIAIDKTELKLEDKPAQKLEVKPAPGGKVSNG